jgi:hypothetical protein
LDTQEKNMKREYNARAIGTVLKVAAGVAAAVLVVSCALSTQLVLDDQWSLSAIKVGSVVTTDLNDYLTVAFNAGNSTATFTIGDLWPGPGTVTVEGEYAYSIDGLNKKITLSQSGEKKHEITYSFDNQLNEMRWTKWVAVDTDPAETVAGSGQTIEYIEFVRAE